MYSLLLCKLFIILHLNLLILHRLSLVILVLLFSESESLHMSLKFSLIFLLLLIFLSILFVLESKNSCRMFFSYFLFSRNFSRESFLISVCLDKFKLSSVLSLFRNKTFNLLAKDLANIDLNLFSLLLLSILFLISALLCKDSLTIVSTFKLS